MAIKGKENHILMKDKDMKETFYFEKNGMEKEKNIIMMVN